MSSNTLHAPVAPELFPDHQLYNCEGAKPHPLGSEALVKCHGSFVLKYFCRAVNDSIVLSLLYSLIRTNKMLTLLLIHNPSLDQVHRRGDYCDANSGDDTRHKVARVAVGENASVDKGVLNVVIGRKFCCVQKDSADYGRPDSTVETFDPPVRVDILDVPGERVGCTLPSLHSDLQKICGVCQSGADEA